MSTYTPNQDAQKRLHSELRKFMSACRPQSRKHEKLLGLIDAIKQRETIYIAEGWVDKNHDVIANEMLFRYRHNGRKVYSYGNIAQDLISADLVKGFDLVNLFNVLSWVPSTITPSACTVNMNHDTLTDPQILQNIADAMKHRDGPPIILEILEDDRCFTEGEITNLKELADQGISFALDDFRVSHDGDWKRLSGLKDIISYVKLDGPDSVRPFVDNGENGLKDMFQHIGQIHNLVGDDKKIICEWVQTQDEAEKLYDRGVHAVQGHNLVFKS